MDRTHPGGDDVLYSQREKDHYSAYALHLTAVYIRLLVDAAGL